MWKTLFLKFFHAGGRGSGAPLPDRGPEVDSHTRATDGRTALLLAANDGQAPRVQALLAAGADIDARDLAGATALMLAAHGGHAAVVQALLAAGADIDARDARNWSALMIAAQAGQLPVVLALADANAGLDASHPRGGAPSRSAQPMRRRSQALT